MSSSRMNEMLSERPLMPADLFKATMEGNSNVLIQRLGLPRGDQNDIQVRIEPSELRCATRFGDTFLHLLAMKHDNLALIVFKKDMSLLRACNKKLETPLHCASKVGNAVIIRDFIRHARNVVRDALGITNENRETALHVAARHNNIEGVLALMTLDPEAAYKEDMRGFSPFYIAIVEGYTSLVLRMLETDPTLACTQFSDGMFPVHVAARVDKDNARLVEHILQAYRDAAVLLDPCGKNLFHMAAERGHTHMFTREFALRENEPNDNLQISQMVENMINVKDYEGNTPFHIAAMKGYSSVMKVIWERLNDDQREVKNQKGETAFDLSVIQVKNTNKSVMNLQQNIVVSLSCATP
ncbi:hypothetical protein LUZ61_000196 [Rhynchospora tenuis]|uniref:Uncharacterized protein n=1 Tax=Rhynchospora tenuis TaxID=198213 RepID=A0AAD6EPL5_9POAL|nr:hypothetical protein LUZ61_000196 [Rhynchospora tenuis]